jgi:Transcriptional regulators containing a DNA-binding HTH domain and an aminotransferase domain (MocR family) and their eukaryotic orthologs
MASAHLTPRGLDALLTDWRGAAPAYESLADRIRLLILDGRIGIDVRLPAERDLAEHLGLSRTTVAAAYRRLRERGFATSVRGSGTITRLPALAPVTHLPAGPELLDFTKAALPATVLLPDAVRAASEELTAYLGDTGYDPVGLPVLREAIARHYTDRGLATEPDEVLVTVGAQQAIALVARALVTRGDRALIEAPTYPHAHEALAAAGARLVTVPVSTETADGWDVDELLNTLRRTSPAVAYVMPEFQNPTGRTMAPAVRRQLLSAAAAQGTIVVADETPGELDIDRRGRYRPLAAYDDGAGAQVLMIGSASKTMWGGLRIGWLRAERRLIRKLAAVRAGFDLGSPILEQLVVARLLPKSPQIVEERRARLRSGRDSIQAAVSERFPQWTTPEVHGGLAMWLNIGVPLSSQLALAARGHGLMITAGPRFGIDGAFERFLRMPLTYTPDAIERAVDALARTWPALARAPFPELGELGAVV